MMTSEAIAVDAGLDVSNGRTSCRVALDRFRQPAYAPPPAYRRLVRL